MKVIAQTVFLFALALRPANSHAGEFQASQAKAIFNSATKPDAQYLGSSTWVQVGGVALHEVAASPWLAGPIGMGTEEYFPPIVIMGKPRMQQRTEMMFRPGSEVSAPILQLTTSISAHEKDMMAGYHNLAWAENDSAITFTITNEGNRQLSPEFPGTNGGSTALFECKAKAPNHLICAATYQADNLESAPVVLRPYAGSIFYYALFQRDRPLKVYAPTIIPAANLPPPPVSTGTAKGYKCVMQWAAVGAQPSATEVLSFTLLNAPARLGKGSMKGVGTSYEKSKPDVFDREVVVSISDDGGSTTFGIVNADVNRISADYDITGKILNAAGLPMIGTITIPHGGGDSTVQYPPSAFQNMASYKKMLPSAPTTAACRELTVPSSPDPYDRGAGAIP